MNFTMGLYRIMIGIYYSKKSCASIIFVLAFLMMVYFYLPYIMAPEPGSYYLNPRVNKMTMKPYVLQQGENVDISKLKLIKVPDYLTELEKCPACFGKDLCHEIDSGAIRIIEPEPNDELNIKGVYNGYWDSEPVVIKRLNKPEEYQRVDEFLCRNVSMEPNCDVSKAIISSHAFAQHENSFKPDFLRSAWKIMHERPDQLAVAACLSDDAIKILSEDFDNNDDGQLSPEERATFFTSLVLNPEALFLEFSKKQGLKIHFPGVLGHCGRIVITEHAGRPISTYLNADFKTRADIGMMLLGMIFFLQNFSSKWSLVFSDFNFDNFYIKDNNIYIVDAEDMLLTDTELYPERKGSYKTMCNTECFRSFSKKLFDYEGVAREDVCPLTPKVTEQAMYSLACERILSHLPEHRKYTPYEGLLHDPPADIADILESALRECVSETRNEGRISAIDTISEILEKFTDYVDYNYDDDVDDEDVVQPSSKPPVKDDNIQNQNEVVANQTKSQGLADQAPNQGLADQAQDQEHANQAQIQGLASLAQNYGQADSQGIPDQAPENKQGIASQVPNQGIVNQLPDQGLANQVPSQGLVNQVPNQGLANQVPNQGLANQVPNQGIVNQVPDQGLTNQVPGQGLAIQVPNQGTVNQVPDQGLANQIPNQGLANQVPNQGIVNQVPDQGLTNQVPGQGLAIQVPNQGTVNQVPDQGLANQIPNQELTNQVPGQGLANQVPNQGIVNQVPNQGLANQIPNQGLANQVPNQGTVNQVPNKGFMNQVPN